MKMRLLRVLFQYVVVHEWAWFFSGTLLSIAGIVFILLDQPGPPLPIDAVLAPGIGTGTFLATLALGVVLILLAFVKAAFRICEDLDFHLRESDANEKNQESA